MELSLLSTEEIGLLVFQEYEQILRAQGNLMLLREELLRRKEKNHDGAAAEPVGGDGCQSAVIGDCGEGRETD